MSAHNYWRLNATSTDGGSTLTLAEIQLRTAAGGSNVANAPNCGTKDLSSYSRIVSNSGSAVFSSAVAKFGSYSLAVLGSSAATLTAPDSNDWAFAGQFTIRCHVYFTSSVTTAAMVAQWGGSQLSWWLGYNSGSINFWWSLNGTSGVFTLTASWTPSLNTQYQIAVDRDASSVIRLYVDGVVKASATMSSTLFNSSLPLAIGFDGGAGDPFPGYIDAVEVSDTARYAGAFTPPTSMYTSDAHTLLLLGMEPSGDGEVTVSSGVSSSLQAFDGSNSTNWALSSGTTGWIQYHFATAQDIVEHAVTAPSATMTNAPNRWTLQYSDDGQNWTSASIVGGQTAWGSNEQRVFTHSSYPIAIGVNTLPQSGVGGQVYTGPVTALSGTVKQNGTPVARTVRAYHRKTGKVLGETVSDGTTGAFSILAQGSTDYCYVVALDDLTAAPDYNAGIFDLVIPV